MQKAWSPTKASGFSVVEALLAATIFGMVAVGVIGAIVYGRQATAGAGEHARASYLAEEGIEAVRNIKAAAYSNLVDGTYGLVQSGGIWTLSGSSDTTGIFTRTVQIASGGTNRKAVTATVSWPQGTATAQTTAVTRLTNWTATISTGTSWANAIFGGSYDASSTNDGLEIATSGSYAYLVRNSGTPNFVIVNISNPASPTLVGSLTLAGNPTNITVSGSYAYVTNANNSGELQIVNVSTPASPSLSGTFNASGNADGLAVVASGNTAYLARAANGGTAEFVIVNVTTPASPTQTGAYGNNIAMNDVVVSGSYAYIGTNSSTQEVLVVNISTPSTPTLATSYNLTTSGTVNALGLYSNTLLIGQAAGLVVYNITNPLSASLSGSVTTTGSATINDIAVDATNTYAFLGTNNTTAEFQIANVSVPASPSIIRAVDVSGTTSNLTGVAHNTTSDIVVGASASDTQEVVTFIKN